MKNIYNNMRDCGANKISAHYHYWFNNDFKRTSRKEDNALHLMGLEGNPVLQAFTKELND